MHTDVLKGDLTNLRSKLELIQSGMENQMVELQKREEKWVKMDEKINSLVVNENDIIRLNVGGAPFATKTGTLVAVKDTLFYKIILSGKFNIKKEIFFDRFSTYFGVILDYLRYKRINYKRYSKIELEELFIEAEYYEITDITNTITNMLKQIRFLSFETNGNFVSGGVTAGTQNIEHLNDYEDRSLKNGIVATTPGWIIIQLNEEWEIDSIEVGGWNGNSVIFSATNGANSTIHTSKDKKTWTNVGTLPSSFGAFIQTVNLTNSTGKYLKFQSTGYLGIGYLKINKK